VLALGLVDVLLLGFASTELDRDVAVTIGGANRNYLTIFQSQNRNGNMPAVLLEQPGHPDFFGDHASAHDQNS